MGAKWTLAGLGVVGLALLAVWSVGGGRGGSQAKPQSLARAVEPAKGASPDATEGNDVALVAMAQVAADAEREAVRVRPVEPIQLAGRVVDSAGRGIGGARVRLGRGPFEPPVDTFVGRVFVADHGGAGNPGDASEGGTGNEPETRAVCDEHGSFVLPVSATDGRVLDVTVDCQGFLAQTFEIRPGEELVLPMERAPCVRGRVLNPDGEPATPPGWVRVLVRAEPPEGTPAGGAQVTAGEVTRRVPLEEDGTFVVGGLPTGRLRWVSAVVQGLPEGELSMDDLLVAEQVRDVELHLESGVRVTGVVVDDATGEPIPGAEVWADDGRPNAENLRPFGRADGAGRFELTGVRARYRDIGGGEEYVILRVLARAEGYSSTPTRAFAAGRSEASAYDFEIRLPRAASSVSGQVVDDRTGDPVRGAHVHLIDAEGEHSVVPTDARGRFRRRDLPAGELTVYARHGELQDLQGSSSVATSLHLEPGAQESLRLRLEAGGASIAGCLVSSGGEPVAGMEVEARLVFAAHQVAVELDSKRTRADGYGRYRIDGLSPGLYHVALPLDGSVDLAARPQMRAVTLGIEGRTRGVDFEVGGSTVFGGWALGLTVPPSRYRVRLTPSGSEAEENSLEVQLSADDSFLFPPCLQGTYELSLLLDERVVASEQVGPGSARDLRIWAQH